MGVVPESVCDDVVYIRMESKLSTAYHTSPKPPRTISRQAVKGIVKIQVSCQFNAKSGAIDQLRLDNRTVDRDRRVVHPWSSVLFNVFTPTHYALDFKHASQ